MEADMNGKDGALQEGDEIAALHRHPQAELSNRRLSRDQPVFDPRGLPQLSAPLSNPLRRSRRDRARAACSGPAASITLSRRFQGLWSPPTQPRGCAEGGDRHSALR